MENNSEARISGLERLLSDVIKEIASAKSAIANGFAKIDANFDGIHKKIDALSGDTTVNFKNVDLTLQSIQEEIINISKVTNYEDQIANLKLLKANK